MESVDLYNQKSKSVSISITATVKNHKLEISGQDLGSLVEEV
ncbi:MULTISPECIES: hypothetical protein [Bacillus]|nr:MULTISPECIES: hypothetical protein [Bacillus]